MDKMMGGAAGGAMQEDVVSMLDAAEKAGALKPLDQYAKEEGLPCSGRELLQYAQNVPETHGKKPEELVAMFRENPDLADEVLAAKQSAKGASEESYDQVRARHLSPKAEGGDETEDDVEE